ncbi:hypothetical protein NLG97_g7917 [Lecanicillium saksenae]|uniref:Uncharacterized protein n=1 Tax=Lecanicillium saksenae TaxID=468837 RepID=A0ACC1QKE8_9HYPO|nr:hypothetical protein NLG97_g7917 [Lecanicillium saksenae]
MEGRLPIPPPRIPSHESYVEYMAGRHAHLGNGSMRINGSMPVNGTAHVNGTQPFNVTDVVNGTLVSVAHALTSYEDDSKGLTIMSYVLLGVFFGCFLLIIGMDMRAKHRSGELRDDMRGAKKMLIILLKIAPMLIMALFLKVASLIRTKKVEPSAADLEAAAKKAQQSQAIVERLAAKSATPETTLSIASF